MKTTFILLLLYWGAERSSMVAPEYETREKCEAALSAAKKVMDSSWAATKGVYGVCTEK